MWLGSAGSRRAASRWWLQVVRYKIQVKSVIELGETFPSSVRSSKRGYLFASHFNTPADSRVPGIIVLSMSSSAEEADEVCASCGIARRDDSTKLKKCACNLVKYCNLDCQKNHRSQHKKACKKRLAQIRDDQLFTQPDGSHLGECPICCLPLPLAKKKSRLMSCCCKQICSGCSHATKKRELEQGLEQRCPFCRELLPKTMEEVVQNYMERVKANDPVALLAMGEKCFSGLDLGGASQYFTKAAALGNMMAHYYLSKMSPLSEGIEGGMKKKIYHLEEAAIGGHPMARHNLGCVEWEKGRIERAMKHFIIAANLGDDEALEEVKKGFRRGVVSKEDYEAALRGHQAAVDEARSTQREEAEKAMEGSSRKG